ncbi:hypothetical protein ACFQFH_13680 [Halobaculum halobium]|uniref:hypothetical protein n=1 Tax=Halobaculum halobium TaxID=3032281 RepID=UPI003608FD39
MSIASAGSSSVSSMPSSPPVAADGEAWPASSVASEGGASLAPSAPRRSSSGESTPSSVSRQESQRTTRACSSGAGSRSAGMTSYAPAAIPPQKSQSSSRIPGASA